MASCRALKQARAKKGMDIFSSEMGMEECLSNLASERRPKSPESSPSPPPSPSPPLPQSQINALIQSIQSLTQLLSRGQQRGRDLLDSGDGDDVTQYTDPESIVSDKP